MPDIITQVPSSSATTSSGVLGTTCDGVGVAKYLQQVQATMVKANQLGNEFTQTQSPEEAKPIADQTNALFMDVMLWKTQDCEKAVQVNLEIVIENMYLSENDMVNGDVNTYNKDYGTYSIALKQLNDEIDKLKNRYP